MKIMIFYTPRSKSTAVHDALANHYSLEPFCDMVTQSRIKNQNFDEYPALIDKINHTDNICAKLNGNDFIDLTNNQLLDSYKDVDFNSFDKIIILSRSDITNAIASYAYMNPADSNTWHKPRGETRVGEEYVIAAQKVFYLLRGYVVHGIISEYIKQQVSPDKIYISDYDTVDQDLKSWFGVDLASPDVPIGPNGYDYKSLARNYDEIKRIAHNAHEIMSHYDLNKILDKDSFFWRKSI